MADVPETLKAYMGAWNEGDEAARLALLQKAWADDATYTDPQSDVAGRDGLSGLIAGFHQQMPGARIEATSGIDQHHDKVRFTWKLVGANGAAMIEGIDFGELAPDGRLQRIVGFFGAPPSA